MTSGTMCCQSRTDLSTLRLQEHVNVWHRVHQDCLERGDVHDEKRAKMSLMLVAVEDAISMDSRETDEESRAGDGHVFEDTSTR